MEDKQTQGIPPWPMFEDGKPVRVGDEVVDEAGEIVYRVSEIAFSDGYGTCLRYEDPRDGNSYNFIDGLEPGKRVKRPPVLAADGEPLHEGETVYVIANGKTHHVTEVDAVSKRFKSMEQVDGSHWLDPMCFTHQRPVLDADGVPIRKGDTVYEVEGTGHAYKVVGIRAGDGDPLTPTVVTCDEGDGTSEHFLPSQLTHRATVLASDGLPLREGDTVWKVKNGDGPYHVQKIRDGVSVCVEEASCEFMPKELTHERPESWEQLEDDATMPATAYCKCMWIVDDGGYSPEEQVARDLVRRCKELSRKENNNG